MIPPHQFIKRYNNFELYLRMPGFEPIPNAFAKVASFILKGEKITALFAFAYSGLDSIANLSDTEIKLLNDAIKIIQKAIDEGKIINNNEYTYEYKNNTFFIVQDPKWWIKTSP